MQRTSEYKLVLALAGSLALAGCEVMTEPNAEYMVDAGASELETSMSEEQPVAEVQELEIEPGHTLSMWRFDDGTTVLAEVGDEGVHEGLLSDSTVGLPLSEIAQIVAPDLGMKELLAPRTDAVALPRYDEVDSPEQRSMTPARTEAKSTDPTTSTGALPGTYVANTFLHCSDTVTAEAADAPVTYCRSGTGALTTPTESCGYFRTNALYEGTSGTATYALYREGLFGSWSKIAQVWLGAKQWGRMYYLSPTRNTMYAKITPPTGKSVSISSHATSVAPRAQENPNWCWLASAQMAMATIGQNREQCNMADQHWGRPSATAGGECCRVWSDDASYVEGDPSCDGGGEACQALTENGMTWNNLSQADVNNALVLEQALQNGPVIIHHPAGPHYSVLSDYREFLIGGTWVPHALNSNPWAPNNYDTGSHMSWVRLDSVGQGNPGGFIDFALSDVRAKGSNLATKIHRISWRNGVATAHFFAPGAQRYEYEFRDSGGSVADGNIWAQGTVNAPASGSPENCWQSGAATMSKASLSVSGWLWYSVKVRACTGSTCGNWVYARSVSRAPIASIGSITGAWKGNLSIPVSAQAAPADTVFRYRVANPTNTTTYRSGKVSGTATRFAKSATINVPLPLGVDVNVQVQACSGNGCSDWVTRAVHTGLYWYPIKTSPFAAH